MPRCKRRTWERASRSNSNQKRGERQCNECGPGGWCDRRWWDLTIAAMSIGGAGAQSTGATTNGNAKAAKAVKNNPLTGTPGSGLTRGVSSSTIKVGCYLQQASFAGADDGFKARFERANNDKELPGGRKIDFCACQDDGGNPQNNLQIVQEARPAGPGLRSGRHLRRRPAAQHRLPEPATRCRTSGGASCPASAPHRWGFGFNGCLVTTPGAKHEGVPGEPGARADRGGGPHAQDHQGRAAGR